MRISLWHTGVINMGARIERIKRTLNQMGVIFGRMGSQTGKILENLDKADKKMNTQLNKSMGTAY